MLQIFEEREEVMWKSGKGATTRAPVGANNRSPVKVFICPLGMDDLGLEDEVEVDFDGTPPLFPRENDPQESLAGQTVSHFSR